MLFHSTVLRAAVVFFQWDRVSSSSLSIKLLWPPLPQCPILSLCATNVFCIELSAEHLWFHLNTVICLKMPLSPPAAAAKSLQSCPTLCDPIESSPPGSPIHGIFQARVLEWVAIAFSDYAAWNAYEYIIKYAILTFNKFYLIITERHMDVSSVFIDYCLCSLVFFLCSI